MLGWLVVNVYSCLRAHFVASGRGRERERGSERGIERGDERFNWVIWAEFLLDYLFFFPCICLCVWGFRNRWRNASCRE